MDTLHWMAMITLVKSEIHQTLWLRHFDRYDEYGVASTLMEAAQWCLFR